MNDVGTAVITISAILAMGAFLFFTLDRLERWQTHKHRADMAREAQRQRETERLVQQMLGFIAPGQSAPTSEEELVDRRTDDEWYYATDEDVVDPLDQMEPDPLQPDPIDPETRLQ